jgi:cob(I)alamin adenosyltransferase
MHTLPEKIGIVNEVVSYMQNADNQTALTAKNFDVTPHIARLQGKLQSLGDLSSEQKLMEVQKQNKTAEVLAAGYDAYNDASGTIDAMMGMLGKGTTAAKKLQTIRSRVRKHASANPPAPAAGAKQ